MNFFYCFFSNSNFLFIQLLSYIFKRTENSQKRRNKNVDKFPKITESITSTSVAIIVFKDGDPKSYTVTLQYGDNINYKKTFKKYNKYYYLN